MLFGLDVNVELLNKVGMLTNYQVNFKPKI